MSSVTMSPQTMADDSSIGTVAWSNPDNAKVSDGVYATAVVNPGAHQSHYLKATNFGFSIPTGAIVNGILIEIERKSSVNSPFVRIADEVIKIVKSDGTIGTINKASAVLWPTTNTYISYGSSSDLWNETWTAEDINDVDFGTVISGVGGGERSTTNSTTAFVDHIRIAVYYTEAPSIVGPFPTFFRP